MLKDTKRNYNIFLLGSGILSYKQLTLETHQILRECKEVYYVVSSPNLVTYLKKVSPKVFDLSKYYENGVPRLTTYNRMVETVLTAAKRTCPIAFLTYGHPLFGVYPSMEILKRATHENLKVKILPAVSSLDALMVDLKIDFMTSGLQMYIADALVLYKYSLNPSVPCIIHMPYQFGSVLFSNEKMKKERFTPLKYYLLSFYPKRHPIYMICSSLETFSPLIKECSTLQNLESLIHKHASGSLFMPPHGNPQADKSYDDLIWDSKHLKSVSVTKA